jgi:hypothetical protein
MKSPPPPPLPNWTRKFPFIQLFSVWSLDIDTCAGEFVELLNLDKFCVALIVAMAMKEHLVTLVVVVAVSIKMINLQDVLILVLSEFRTLPEKR